MKTLMRSELYDLVWSRPMTEVAAEFDLSDVGLKKICKAAYVPTPPLGYWAKVKSGKRATKATLPTLYPFQSQLVRMGSKNRYGYEIEPELSDAEIAVMALPDPPRFENSLEEYKQIIEAFVPKISIPTKLTKVHSVAKRLSDAQNALVKQKYSLDKPKYDHPNGAKVFSALNSLFFYFEGLGFRVRMHGPRSQSLSIDMDGQYHHFRLVSLDDPNGFRRKRGAAGMNFGFAWTYEEWHMAEDRSYREYVDLTPDVLRDLAIELFVEIESARRRSLEWRFERKVEEKNDAISRIKAKRDAEAKQLREAIERQVLKRFELMNESLLLISKSDQIRELIASLDKKIGNAKKPVTNYSKWRSWAEHQANSMDPRNMSTKRLGRWVQKFSFK
jgi:hypothetical protein